MFKELKDGEENIRKGVDITGNHIGELITKVDMLYTGMMNEYCKIINNTYPDSLAFSECWYYLYQTGINDDYKNSIKLVINEKPK